MAKSPQQTDWGSSPSYPHDEDRALQGSDTNENKQWGSVHKCPKCGHVLNLSEIDLMTVTTGIVDCLKCGWSGPIEIQIVERERPLQPALILR